MGRVNRDVFPSVTSRHPLIGPSNSGSLPPGEHELQQHMLWKLSPSLLPVDGGLQPVGQKSNVKGALQVRVCARVWVGVWGGRGGGAHMLGKS